MKGLFCALLVASGVLLGTSAGPAKAQPVDLTNFAYATSGGDPVAAAHQDFTTSFSFCDLDTNPDPRVMNCTAQQRSEDARNVVVSAPAGLIGNSQAPRNTGVPRGTPFCENSDYVADNCPKYSIIGYSTTYVLLQGGILNGTEVPLVNQPVYNVRPQGSELGKLGAIATLDLVNKNYLPTLVTVRTSTDYGLDNVVLDLPQKGITPVDPMPVPIKVARIDFTLCGYLTGDDTPGNLCTSTPGANNPPFINMPTNCQNHAMKISANSYEDATPSTAEINFRAGGCEDVPFNPAVDISASNEIAGAPSAYDVDLNVPTTGANGRRQAHVKKSTTLLPQGVRLNAAAAQRLDKCTDDQFGYGNDDAVACPPAAQIGDVRIESDSIDGDPQDDDMDPMTGAVYFAQPTDAKPWRVFAVAEGGGLRQKLIGNTTLDQSTGRLTTVFDDNPQLPFSKIRLSLRGGSDSVLLNPPSCGSFSGSQTAEPWSDVRENELGDDISAFNPVTSSDTIITSFDGAGAPCPASTPFAPTVSASATNPAAGGDPGLTIALASPDNNQPIKAADVALPAGLVGRLKGMSLCGAAAASAGDCSEDSRIAKVVAGIGATQASSTNFSGSMYLAEPIVAGDPASVSVVMPARTGPIDLGELVVRGRVKLRQSDGGLTVSVQDIPTMFKGVPIPLRRATIKVDRKDFMRNPTGCAVREVRATIDGLAPYGANGVAQVVGNYQASGCDQLGFAPKIAFFTGGKGQTGNESHPPIRTVISVPDSNSSIARAVVVLPDVFRPDTVNLNKPGVLCQQSQLDGAGCPAPSRVGSAEASTALLPSPLSGPVYIVQTPGQVLPKLVAELDGMVKLRLEGQSSLTGIRTMTDFASNPDVPVTRFALTLDGGKQNGILKTRGSLCNGQPAADVSFTAHSGATNVQKPSLNVAGCSKLTISKKTIRIKNGVASVPVACEFGPCAGKLSLVTSVKVKSRAKGKGKKKKKVSAKSVGLGSKSFDLSEGEAGTVKVKLPRSGLRRLRDARRLSVSAKADIAGEIASQSFVLTTGAKAKARRR